MGHAARRRLRTLRNVACMLALVLALLPGSLPALTQNADATLDLPSMTLRPDDLVAAGREGFGIERGMMVNRESLDTLAAWPAAVGWAPGVPDGEAYLAANPERAYLLQLARDVVEGDLIYSTQVVSVVLFSYRLPADAAGGFEAMAATLGEAGTLDELPVDVAIGEGHILLGGELDDPQNPQPVQRMTLLFHTDTVLASITVQNFVDSDPPTQDFMEALGERQLGRIEAGLSAGGPGLGTSILRLAVPVEGVWVDRYEIIDGELLCASDLMSGCAERQARAEEEGNVHRYWINHVLGGQWDANEPRVEFGIGINVFESDDAAAGSFSATLASYRDAVPDLAAMEEVTDIPVESDEAIGILYEREDGVQVYILLILVGDTVLHLVHSTTPGVGTSPPTMLQPNPEAVNALATIQIACLAGNESCLDPVPVPADLQV